VRVDWRAVRSSRARVADVAGQLHVTQGVIDRNLNCQVVAGWRDRVDATAIAMGGRQGPRELGRSDGPIASVVYVQWWPTSTSHATSSVTYGPFRVTWPTTRRTGLITIGPPPLSNNWETVGRLRVSRSTSVIRE
jgi:hypothetical protein